MPAAIPAIVGSESVCPADGTISHQSKLVPLVHMPAIITMRGVYGLFPLVFMSCALYHRDFDALLEDKPTMLRDAFGVLVQWQTHGINKTRSAD